MNDPDRDASFLPSVTDVYKARRHVYRHAIQTPLVRSDSLSELTGGNVWLKVETVQQTGSFKIRGAANKILSLSEDERARGLITISSGNHGRAVSAIARNLGVRATICLSTYVPDYKCSAIERAGGTINVCGDSYEEAEVEALKLLQDKGMTMVSAFDDPLVIAGQGTIGLEIAEQIPEVDDVIVPLSGGGLFSGIGLAVRSCLPGARLIGVANEYGDGMLASLEADRPVPVQEFPTLADCMAGSIGADNRYTFKLTRQLIDMPVKIPEAEIVPALKHGFNEERLVLEGGSALPIATILRDPKQFKGRTAVLVLTGQNIHMDTFRDAVLG